MFRLITLLLVALPNWAAAEWSPLPQGFSYEATFARCTIDQDRPDTQICAALLQDAYVLNRAVAHAVAACDGASLKTCATPFEARGLPSIAARIAADSACDVTPAVQFPAIEPLPQDHCITIIADILRDEGVAPLDAPPSAQATCTLDQQTCEDLINIQATFWHSAVIALSDTPLTQQRSDAAWDACLAQNSETYATAACYAAALAQIWADLTQAQAQDL